MAFKLPTIHLRSKSDFSKVAIILLLLLSSIGLIAWSFLQQRIYRSPQAWSETHISVASECSDEAQLRIKVTLTNQEGRSLDAIATDVASGKSVDMGTIPHGTTKTSFIELTDTTTTGGSIKVFVQWTEGSGTDSFTKEYDAITCKASVTPSNSPTPSTVSPTMSTTPSHTKTPTPSQIISPTKSLTPSSTPTGAQSASPTKTKTPTPTDTVMPTKTLTPSITPTGTLSPSPTATNTPTPSATIMASHTPTKTITPSQSATPTEVIIALSSSTSTPEPTKAPTTAAPTILAAGVPVQWFILAIPAVLLVAGLFM